MEVQRRREPQADAVLLDLFADGFSDLIEEIHVPGAGQKRFGREGGRRHIGLRTQSESLRTVRGLDVRYAQKRKIADAEGVRGTAVRLAAEKRDLLTKREGSQKMIQRDAAFMHVHKLKRRLIRGLSLGKLGLSPLIFRREARRDPLGLIRGRIDGKIQRKRLHGSVGAQTPGETMRHKTLRKRADHQRLVQCITEFDLLKVPDIFPVEEMVRAFLQKIGGSFHAPEIVETRETIEREADTENFFAGGQKQLRACKTNQDDFGLSKFIVCTDAGLSSANNKFFNSRKNRDFITATSVKKLPKERRERLLQHDGWKVVGGDSKKTYNLAEIDADENAKTLYYDRTFYKEEWFIDEVEIYDEELQKTVKRNLSQRLILTFSFKYKAYLQAIRDRRIERAKKLIKQGDKAVNRRGRNDVRDYIQEVAFTETGEVAEHKAFVLNESAIAEAASYDGYYAVYTSLDTKKYPVTKVNDLNHGRWEIEECFRIMKSEFLARPVYLKREDRIKAHFLTCFIALLILRILEHKIAHEFTYPEIIECLSGMDFTKIKEAGYIPSYTRTDLTDKLHEVFGFRTDYEIMVPEAMKKIFSLTKKA